MIVAASRALRLALALLALESLVLLWLWHGWPMLALMLHAAVSLAANALVWRRAILADAPVATLRLAAMMLPFLGPVAPLAAICLLAGQIVRPITPPDAALWHDHLFPNLAADPINDRMEEITRRAPGTVEQDEVESFFDVLRWGTLPEREHVLSLISRSFRAEFAPVLREALASNDVGLRAQAAAGLSALETRISARLGVLQRSLQTATTADSRREAAVTLAHALADAAHSSLYDELRTTEMRREIVLLLTSFGDTRPTDPALVTILGRTLIQLGDLDEAVTVLTRSIEHADESDNHTDAAFGWLLEALFRQGDFKRVSQLLDRRRDQARAMTARDTPLAPALTFWEALT